MDTLYVEIISSEPAASADMKSVYHEILRYGVQHSLDPEILDEQYWNKSRAIKIGILRISDTEEESLRAYLASILGNAEPSNVKLSMFKGGQDSASNLQSTDLLITKVTSEMYVSSQMVSWESRGVAITHLPTGLSSRCTAHHACHRNQSEALGLLGAKVAQAIPGIQSNSP